MPTTNGEKPAPTFIKPQFVIGYRSGSRFSTVAGIFVNGAKTTKEIAEAMKAQGYALRDARKDEIVEIEGRVERAGFQSLRGAADLPVSARNLSNTGAAGQV